MNQSNFEEKTKEMWSDVESLLIFFSIVSQLQKFRNMSLFANKFNCLVLQVKKLPDTVYEDSVKQVVLNPVTRRILRWESDYYYELYSRLELIMHLGYACLEILACSLNRINQKYPSTFRRAWEKELVNNPLVSSFDSHYWYISEIRTEWTHYSGFTFDLDLKLKKMYFLLTNWRRESDKKIHTEEKRIDLVDLIYQLENFVILVTNVLHILFFELQDSEDLQTRITIFDDGIRGFTEAGIKLGLPNTEEITIQQLIEHLKLDKLKRDPVQI